MDRSEAGPRGMTRAATVRAPDRRSARAVCRVAYVAWVALLSLLLGVPFVGVTAPTLSLWLTGRNRDTTPVTDLGFFAPAGVLVTTRVLAQPQALERYFSGLQRAVIGLLALGLTGLVGQRIEPLVGSSTALTGTVELLVLHPARRALFAIEKRPRMRLAALALVAAVPAGVIATILSEARRSILFPEAVRVRGPVHGDGRPDRRPRGQRPAVRSNTRTAAQRLMRGAFCRDRGRRLGRLAGCIRLPGLILRHGGGELGALCLTAVQVETGGGAGRDAS